MSINRLREQLKNLRMPGAGVKHSGPPKLDKAISEETLSAVQPREPRWRPVTIDLPPPAGVLTVGALPRRLGVSGGKASLQQFAFLEAAAIYGVVGWRFAGTLMRGEPNSHFCRNATVIRPGAVAKPCPWPPPPS